MSVKQEQLINFDINKETYNRSQNNSFMKKYVVIFKLLEEKCLEYKKSAEWGGARAFLSY